MVNTVKIPSKIKYIKQVSTEILNSLSPFGIDENRLFDIRLCTEEAVRNAVVHGNRSNKKLSVKVRYWTENDRLIIEVEDAGSGFNPGDLPDPTEDSNMMKNSGRGVYLIMKLMDNVNFSAKGNMIRMEKKLK